MLPLPGCPSGIIFEQMVENLVDFMLEKMPGFQHFIGYALSFLWRSISSEAQSILQQEGYPAGGKN